MTCNSVEKNIKEKNYGNLCQIAQKTGSNFVLRDRELSFSYDFPYGLISRKDSSDFKIIVSDSDSFPTRGEGDFTVSCAEGTRENFSQIFVNKSLRQDWRRGEDSNPRCHK